MTCAAVRRGTDEVSREAMPCAGDDVSREAKPCKGEEMRHEARPCEHDGALREARPCAGGDGLHEARPCAGDGAWHEGRGEPVWAVEFDHVSFSYAGAAASEGSCEASANCLRDVTLGVAPGECVVVTGPSGCGKTTLTRMVNGLIPGVYSGNAKGSVRVLGRGVEQWEMDDLSCAVGSVFQNPRSQFFNLDTTSEVAFGCENMGVPREEIRERVRQTAHNLAMEHLMERDIRALSGGEKQTVALASVHAMHPSIFVLDEPTAALDVAAMRRLSDTVARCKAAGNTVIVAEHRLWWLAGVADRIVIMEDGRIVDDVPAGSFDAWGRVERERRGVRAWDIREVVPQADGADASSEDLCGTEAKAAWGGTPRGEGELQRDVGKAPVAGTRSAEAPCPGAQNAGEPSPWSQCEGSRAILRVDDLTVRYGRRGRAVLDGLNFTAHAGRAIALLGHNGAGKTTFARCLAGLHAESAGRVVVEGSPLTPRQRAGRVYLAMQESGYQLFSDSVAGELLLALRAARTKGAEPCDPGEDDAFVRKRLADFGLLELADRHPLSLSGGQMQRLAIVAGAIQGARVIVLDEPTSGLDLRNMRLMVHEIDRLKRQGTCIVIITHDFEFACASCDEVAVLGGGLISEHFALDATTLERTRTLFGFEG